MTKWLRNYATSSDLVSSDPFTWSFPDVSSWLCSFLDFPQCLRGLRITLNTSWTQYRVTHIHIIGSGDDRGLCVRKRSTVPDFSYSVSMYADTWHIRFAKIDSFRCGRVEYRNRRWPLTMELGYTCHSRMQNEQGHGDLTSFTEFWIAIRTATTCGLLDLGA